jgi:hypothetical protein
MTSDRVGPRAEVQITANAEPQAKIAKAAPLEKGRFCFMTLDIHR